MNSLRIAVSSERVPCVGVQARARPQLALERVLTRASHLSAPARVTPTELLLRSTRYCLLIGDCPREILSTTKIDFPK
jgi:hypothetical protein